MKQLIIDRSQWRTGGDKWNWTHGETKLLNEKGNMCCLGFYCLQLGEISKNQILGISLPEDLNNVNVYDDAMLHLVYKNDLRNTHFTEEAIDINDAEELTNEEREKEIIKHFKQIDVEVVFTNDYNDTGNIDRVEEKHAVV